MSHPGAGDDRQTSAFERLAAVMGVRTRTRPSITARGSAIGVLLLVAVGAGVVFLAVKARVDAASVWDHIRTANPALLATALGVYYLSMVIRAIRWRVIMDNASTGAAGPVPARSYPVWTCFNLVLIGRFVDAIVWLRPGNMYRAYLASARHPRRIPQVFGTILSENVLDALVVFAAVLAVCAYIAIRGIELPIAAPVLAGTFSVAAMLLLLGFLRRYGVRIARRLPRPVAGMYLRLHRGLMHGLRNRRLTLLTVLSAGGWFLAVARWYLVIVAFGATVSFPMVMFVSLINVLIVAIPITPGGLGLVEPTAAAVLSIGLPVDLAAAAVLTERAISYMSLVVVGAIVFYGRPVVGWVRRRRLAVETEAMPSRRESERRGQA